MKKINNQDVKVINTTIELLKNIKETKATF